MLGMSLHMLPAMKCSVCNSLILEENNNELDKLLFGAKKYSVCPNCNSEVPEKKQTEAYKKRVDKYYKR